MTQKWVKVKGQTFFHRVKGLTLKLETNFCSKTVDLEWPKKGSRSKVKHSFHRVKGTDIGSEDKVKFALFPPVVTGWWPRQMGVKVKGQGHRSKLGQSSTETRHQTKNHSPMKHAQTYTSHPPLRFKWTDHRCTCTQVYTSTQKLWSIIASHCQPLWHPPKWSVLNP